MEHSRDKIEAVAGLMNLKSNLKDKMNKTHEIIRDIRIRMEALISDTGDIKKNMDMIDEIIDEVLDGKNLSYMMGETNPYFMLGVRKRSRTVRKNGGERIMREHPKCELNIIRNKLKFREIRERRNWEYDNHD